MEKIHLKSRDGTAYHSVYRVIGWALKSGTSPGMIISAMKKDMRTNKLCKHIKLNSLSSMNQL